MLSAREPIDQILRQLLRFLPFLERQISELSELLATKGLPEDLLPIVPWASLYDMPFVRHTLCVAQAMGATEELKALVQSPSPNLAILRAVEREAAGEEAPINGPPNLSLSVGGVFSTMANMRALGSHGVPINRMLAIGAAGNDPAFIKAIRIDPTVLSSKTLSPRLARAVVERDAKFLTAANAAIRDAGKKAPSSAS